MAVKRPQFLVRVHGHASWAARQWLRAWAFVGPLAFGGFLLFLLGFGGFDSNAPLIAFVRQSPTRSIIGGIALLALTLLAFWLVRMPPPSNQQGSPQTTRKSTPIGVTKVVATSSTSLLLVLMILVVFQPFGCQFAYCRAQAPGYVPGGSHDSAVEVYLRGYQSNYYVMADDPSAYSLSRLPSKSVGAVSLDGPAAATSQYSLVLAVHNLRSSGPSVLIQQVYLLIKDVPALSSKLNVWQSDSSVAYRGNPYQVKYTGQRPGSDVRAQYLTTPAGFVQLTSGETDNLELRLSSIVPGDVKFEVKIVYYFASEGQMHSLTLDHLFEVVFSTRANWHPYVLAGTRFVPAG